MHWGARCCLLLQDLVGFPCVSSVYVTGAGYRGIHADGGAGAIYARAHTHKHTHTHTHTHTTHTHHTHTHTQHTHRRLRHQLMRCSRGPRKYWYVQILKILFDFFVLHMDLFESTKSLIQILKRSLYIGTNFQKYSVKFSIYCTLYIDFFVLYILVQILKLYIGTNSQKYKFSKVLSKFSVYS